MQLFSQPPQRQHAPVVIPQDVPVYKVGENKFYCDEELHEPGTILAFTETPPPDFIPLNELALKKMREYLGELDEHGKVYAKENKKKFISLLDAFDQAQAQIAGSSRRANRLGGNKERPMFANKVQREQRVSKIDVDQTPEVVLASSMKEAMDKVMDNGLTPSGNKKGTLGLPKKDSE